MCLTHGTESQEKRLGSLPFPLSRLKTRYLVEVPPANLPGSNPFELNVGNFSNKLKIRVKMIFSRIETCCRLTSC